MSVCLEAVASVRILRPKQAKNLLARDPVRKKELHTLTERRVKQVGLFELNSLWPLRYHPALHAATVFGRHTLLVWGGVGGGVVVLRVVWREQLQLFSPALLRARRRATVPTLQHSPSIHSREATRPHARPRPHLLCFNVLPWSQRASRHDSIAMAGALWIAKAHGPLRRAARAGATQIRALAPRAFISAFSCRCSVGSNSPYSHSAAGG